MGDSRRTGPSRDSPDSSDWNPGSPFFAGGECRREGLGTDAKGPLADRELGAAEELFVDGVGQELSEPTEFGFGTGSESFGRSPPRADPVQSQEFAAWTWRNLYTNGNEIRGN